MDEVQKLIGQRETLFEQLRQLKFEIDTIEREIEDATEEVYRSAARRDALVQRFLDGHIIIVSLGRHWWVSESGQLLELATQSEIDTLKRLGNEGVIEHVVTTRSI